MTESEKLVKSIVEAFSDYYLSVLKEKIERGANIGEPQTTEQLIEAIDATFSEMFKDKSKYDEKVKEE